MNLLCSSSDIRPKKSLDQPHNSMISRTHSYGNTLHLSISTGLSRNNSGNLVSHFNSGNSSHMFNELYGTNNTALHQLKKGLYPLYRRVNQVDVTGSNSARSNIPERHHNKDADVDSLSLNKYIFNRNSSMNWHTLDRLHHREDPEFNKEKVWSHICNTRSTSKPCYYMLRNKHNVKHYTNIRSKTVNDIGLDINGLNIHSAINRMPVNNWNTWNLNSKNNMCLKYLSPSPMSTHSKCNKSKNTLNKLKPVNIKPVNIKSENKKAEGMQARSVKVQGLLTSAILRLEELENENFTYAYKIINDVLPVKNNKRR